MDTTDTPPTETVQDGRTNAAPERRGQAALIGIILLIGIVAIGSIGILLIGAQATDSAREDGQDEQARQAFVELHAGVDSVAYGEERSRTIDLELPDESEAAIRKDNTGKIKIIRKNLTTTDTVVVKNIGSITYERGGTVYAYQAGAVWKGTGRNAQMVSAPGLDYSLNETGESPTLTFPIVDLTGDEQLSSGRVGIRKRTTRAPLNDVTTIDNQIVKIVIQSDYYYGWGRYFQDRYDNAVVAYRDSSNTAVIRLGRRNIDGGWGAAVYSMTGDITTGGGSNEINGEVYAPGTIDCGSGSCTKLSSPPDGAFGDLSPVVLSKIDRAQNDADYATTKDITDGTTLTGNPNNDNEVYYEPDGFNLTSGKKATVDLSDGNVTLVVNGDLNLTKSDFKVKNGDGTGPKAFRVYTKGNLSMKNARFCGDSDCTKNSFGSKKTAEDLQIYGTSNMTVGLKGGNTKFEGAVYAPREEEVPGPNKAYIGTNAQKCDDNDGDPHHADVCIVNGDNAVYGSIVAGPMRVSQSSISDYDSDLANVQPQLMKAGAIPPRITYLHVSVTEVAVTQEG